MPLRLLCLFSAFGLGGCVSNDPFDTARPPTTAEKQLVIATARNELYDPFSIRGAELSEVITLEDGHARRRILCARYDSKAKSGEWTGRETHLVAISGSSTVMSSLRVPDSEMPCDRLKYAPFPEAERLRRG